MRTERRYFVVVGKESSARFSRNSLSGPLWALSIGYRQLWGPGSKRAVPTSFPHDHPPPLENSTAVPFTEAGFHSILNTEAWDLSAAASNRPSQSSGSQQILILWVCHELISSEDMQILLVLGPF